MEEESVRAIEESVKAMEVESVAPLPVPAAAAILWKHKYYASYYTKENRRYRVVFLCFYNNAVRRAEI